MPESKKPSNLLLDLRCVPVNSAHSILPSMPASVPAGMVEASLDPRAVRRQKFVSAELPPVLDAAARF